MEYSPSDEGAARTFKIMGLGDYKLQTEPRLPIAIRAKEIETPVTQELNGAEETVMLTHYLYVGLNAASGIAG